MNYTKKLIKYKIKHKTTHIHHHPQFLLSFINYINHSIKLNKKKIKQTFLQISTLTSTNNLQ